MAPIVHGLETRYGQQVDFLYLDIQDSTTAPAKARFGFKATPHFFLLAPDGKVLEEWQGVQDRAVLERALQQVSQKQVSVAGPQEGS
jgi:thioredoxin-like negative regulator of GroEL